MTKIKCFKEKMLEDVTDKVNEWLSSSAEHIDSINNIKLVIKDDDYIFVVAYNAVCHKEIGF